MSTVTSRREDEQGFVSSSPEESQRCSFASFGQRCANFGTMTASCGHKSADQAHWFCRWHFFPPTSPAALELADKVVRDSQGPREYLTTVEDIRNRYRLSPPPGSTEIERVVVGEIKSPKGLGWAHRLVRLAELGASIPDSALRMAQSAIGPQVEAKDVTTDDDAIPAGVAA